MPSIAGKYQHYKNEDVEDYFIAVGVPYMARKMMSISSPLMEISFDGEYMTIKSSSMLRVTENKFKLGEEYEEKMPSGSIKSKTEKVSDDEIITESIVPDTGDKCQRIYKFSDDGCVVTLTHAKAAKAGKRYFRRVE